MTITRKDLIQNAVLSAGNEKTYVGGFYPNSSGGFGSTLPYGDSRIQYKVVVYYANNAEINAAIAILESDERVESAFISRDAGHLRVNFKESYAAEQSRLKLESN